MTTNGIGNAITAIGLGQMSSPQPLINLDFSNSVVINNNGRFVGTTRITGALAQQILANPSQFTLFVNTPSRNNAVVGTLAAGNELFVPVVGTVRGLNGTNWKTSLNVFNGSVAGTDATALLQFFPSSAPGTAAQNVALMTVPASSMSNTFDISGTLFPGLNGIGALRIVTAGNVFANARVFNDLSSTARGTFGQSVPALARSRALSQGVLVGLSNGAAMRTNVGIFNPNETFTTLELELRDAGGNVAATRIVTLPPFTLSQGRTPA